MFLRAKHIIQGVIGGQLRQFTLTEAIQSAVATVDRIEDTTIIGQSHEGGTHALVLFVGTSLGSHKVIDGVEPLDHHLVEVARIQFLGDIREIVLQVAEHVVAGDIAPVMTTHAIGHCHQVPVVMIQRCLCRELTVTNKMSIDQYHILVLASYTANLAGGRYF